MMGANLANVALAKWAPHVSDRAFRVLMRMAVTALDKDGQGGQKAGLYFAGADLLAMTMRTTGRASREDTAHRIVRYAIAELMSVGAIRYAEKPRRGHRPVYQLTLDSGITVPLKGNDDSGMDGDSGTHIPESGTLHSPLGTKGLTTSKERQDEDGLSSQPYVETAREDFAANDDLPVDDCCPKCGVLLDPDGTCFNRHCRLEVVA